MDSKMLLDIFHYQLYEIYIGGTRSFSNKNDNTISARIDYMVNNLPISAYRCKSTQPNTADHLCHIVIYPPNSINDFVETLMWYLDVSCPMKKVLVETKENVRYLRR